MGKRNPYAGSLAQGQYRQRVVTDKRADAYRRLIASYMVETVAPDPAQEESWQEPLRQPDDD